MNSVENSIRDVARTLLSEKKVDLIIGYEQGKVPLRTTPCFVNKAEDVQRLVWNACCDANLAKYLVGRKEKVGIVAKGCDARSITVCIIEKQIAKEKAFIIGVPCSGIVDRKKIDMKLEGREILEATVDDEKITLKGEDFKSV